MATQNGHSGGVGRLTARQRGRQLTETAARRFHRYGFHGVALIDVARDVGITAPALYRHFRNKNALLAATVHSGLDLVDAAFTTGGESWVELLSEFAGVALVRRDLWALLQREVRHLGEPERHAVEARFDDFVARLSMRLRAVRPDADSEQRQLLLVAVLGTLASPAVSGLRIGRERYQRVLTAAAIAASKVSLPAVAAAPRVAMSRQRSAVPQTRGEQLLETAVSLFHERGYTAVTLDDIGAAVGLAGPSIYHHFATKSDLLVTAFSKAARRLALSRASGVDEAVLDNLVRGYIELGVQQRQLFGVYVTEAVNLPPEAGRRIRRELAANVAEWRYALQRSRPELGEATSSVLVHAARGIVNDVVRVGGLHARPGIVAELTALVRGVLNTAVPKERGVSG
ncbi:TetR/AcrR family transcriptional regulator [Amycolatopsis acidiphila]|uniref:TetR/AcrR family transcriptional regulator n=1 Tax=Amycolatopsis acidiphila TaxID=715473 RepID=A0A558AHS9_9PSEU|nr:TetR/AcrR family transcriptional regulator [Amycolatopsis acidiphila]TVT23842.1 TetR/AcrR family transcriptional regulator [Amycolatopsis acidiphila]UIJ61182.1 TetR/AcrR family transcriptional regulator [Amycolatopsis acidiphila]